jgi:hypothetical protein
LAIVAAAKVAAIARPKLLVGRVGTGRLLDKRNRLDLQSKKPSRTVQPGQPPTSSATAAAAAAAAAAPTTVPTTVANHKGGFGPRRAGLVDHQTGPSPRGVFNWVKLPVL